MKRQRRFLGPFSLVALATLCGFMAVPSYGAETESRSIAQLRKTGLILSTPEQRAHFPIASPPTLSKGTAPPAVDLSAGFPKPGSQGNQGTCTAWALASYRTYLFARKNRLDPNSDDVRSSPAFIFGQIADSEEMRECNYSMIEDGMRLLSVTGVVSERDYPYDARSDGCHRPPPSASLFEKAKAWRTAGWAQVEWPEPRQADFLKAFLANHEPVVISLKVGSKFEALGAEVMRDSEISDCANCGNHAMVLVGYDDVRGAFKVLNSWGEGWGDQGFGWVSYPVFAKKWNYAYVASDRLASAPGLLEQVNDDRAHTAVGQAVRIPVLKNDRYDLTKVPRIYVSSRPEYGTARVEGSMIVYEPPKDFVGTDRFYYSLVDSLNRRGVARVSVDVLTLKQEADEVGRDKVELARKRLEEKRKLIALLVADGGVQVHYPKTGAIEGAELRLRIASEKLQVQVDSLALSPHGREPVLRAIAEGRDFRICAVLESKDGKARRPIACGTNRRRGQDVFGETIALPLPVPQARLEQVKNLYLWLMIQVRGEKSLGGGAQHLLALLSKGK